MIRQLLAGALDCEPLLVEEAADLEHELHILPPGTTVTRVAFHGPQAGELRFPVPQDVGFGLGQLADLADAEVKLIGNLQSPCGCVVLPAGAGTGEAPHEAPV